MQFKAIKTGEVLNSTMYLTVQGKTADAIQVKDNFGREFTVKGPKLIEEAMNSANQYSKEEKVTRTEAAAILTSAGDAAFTVTFDKADGTERTLVGKLVDTENHMGRSNVDDLQVTSGSPRRQVDHRTIKQITLKGVKYTVKK